MWIVVAVLSGHEEKSFAGVDVGVGEVFYEVRCEGADSLRSSPLNCNHQGWLAGGCFSSMFAILLSLARRPKYWHRQEARFGEIAWPSAKQAGGLRAGG